MPKFISPPDWGVVRGCCQDNGVELHMRLYGTGEWWTDEACEHCIEFSRKIDEESPEKFAAFYHRIIRPDTATDEEIISVEVMLTRWIRFIDLCVKLVV